MPSLWALPDYSWSGSLMHSNENMSFIMRLVLFTWACRKLRGNFFFILFFPFSIAVGVPQLSSCWPSSLFSFLLVLCCFPFVFAFYTFCFHLLQSYFCFSHYVIYFPKNLLHLKSCQLLVQARRLW